MTWCRKTKVGCGNACFLLQYQSRFGGLICRIVSFSVSLFAPYDTILNSLTIAATFDKLQVAALIFAIFCCLRVICAALYFTQLSRHLHQNMLLSFMKLPFVAETISTKMSPKKTSSKFGGCFFGGQELNGANDGKGLIVSFPEVEKQTSTKTLYSLGGFLFWFPKIAFARKEKLLFGDRNGAVYQEMPTMRTESQGDASTTSLSCQTHFFSFRSKQPKKVGICAAPVNVLVWHLALFWKCWVLLKRVWGVGLLLKYVFKDLITDLNELIWDNISYIVTTDLENAWNVLIFSHSFRRSSGWQ